MRHCICSGTLAVAALAVLAGTGIAAPFTFGTSPVAHGTEVGLDRSLVGAGDWVSSVEALQRNGNFDDATDADVSGFDPAGETSGRNGRVTLNTPTLTPDAPPALPVPEPQSLWLLGSTLLGVVGFRRARGFWRS